MEETAGITEAVSVTNKTSHLGEKWRAEEPLSGDQREEEEHTPNAAPTVMPEQHPLPPGWLRVQKNI